MKVRKLKRARLIDLRVVSDRDINYTTIMENVFKYKNNWLSKKLFFKRKFRKAYIYMDEIRNVDPGKVEWTESCSINKPAFTDYISFRAMMELHALINGKSNDHIADLMASVISIICYQEHTKAEKYVSSSDEFKEFKEFIYEQPAIEMMGLYNLLMKQMDESAKMWNQRFMSVEIKDEDYDLANRGRLAQFNIVNTLKQICNDFNLTYDEAWQMSYNLVQTNSYSKATSGHVEDQMRQIKESRMKRDKRRH